ncbi:hypothetical protein GGQ92_001806 [Gracilibacillus halotolerans]|uniref:DUF4830 domain-containing protein n=1 Tax=Gracilibacillus halotolerans TaxID=74386 RepID=A0A841RNL9_9BACI|nr:hypothetical protein [Gracilibacillus halotolerans]MBB6513016.1 hypothetical protein [Gracilibacillus halotolerans]
MKRIANTKYWIMIITIVLVISSLYIVIQQKNSSQSLAIVEDYLKEQGFKLLSYEGQTEAYQLTIEKIQNEPYDVYWDGHLNNPDSYMGKTVKVEKFAVENHPLNEWTCCGDVKTEEMVYTYVFVIDDKVVGGIAFPDVLDELGIKGGFWSSLDGEIQTTRSY